MALTFGELQEKHWEWVRRNFGAESGSRAGALNRLTEELAELAEHEPDAERLRPFLLLLGRLVHADNKAEDGIRGSRAEHEARARDAVGDMTVLLAFYCQMQGWDYQEVVEATWAEVGGRDWRRDPQGGRAGREEL